MEGEVHGLRRFGSGTAFTLRDRTCRVPVWWSASGKGECRVTEGSTARVTGRLRWDNNRGSLQLAAEQALPTGAGEVAELIAAARERLRAVGLLDRARRPVPALPTTVGVVCGREAAVRRDIESVVAQRWPGYPLRFVEVGVTGAGAPQAIADALRSLASDPEVQVVILARGGGDAADLLPWSDEDLCRAVAESPVAVVSAIGHEEDRPLCDEVADLRCGTPSLAAAAVIPDAGRLRSRLDDLLAAGRAGCERRLDLHRNRVAILAPHRALDQRAAAARHRLTRAADAFSHRHPGQLAVRARQRLGALERDRESGGPGPMAGRARLQLLALEREREALSPERVLERGYAVVRRPGSAPAVRDAASVEAGEQLEVTLARGRLMVRAQENDHEEDGDG